MAQQLALVFQLLQQTCIFLVIAWILAKTPLFTPLMQVTIRLPHKLTCYVVFSGFCVLGTLLGLHVGEAIANIRAIGAVLGGLLGGPSVGLAVGLTGGLHRYGMGGPTDIACMVSTVTEGLLGGLVHRLLIRRGRVDLLFQPMLVGLVTLAAEIVQMLIILALTTPYATAFAVVNTVALPMLTANSIGSAMFMRLLLDRRAMLEKYSNAFSARALRIAARTDGVLRGGLSAASAQKVATIIAEETGVGAVAITDRERLLAFTGTGADHHLPGTPIVSTHTLEAIRDNRVVYADGNEVAYTCSIHPECRLGSTLVIPLQDADGQVIGTIKLYEPKGRLFARVNRTLGEGIANLLARQILTGRLESQRSLLSQTEIKLLHAQVNPHFLFNALNTINAVIRIDPDRARTLVQHLSTFFRKNLKRPEEEVTLAEEIEHVNAYLQIELARFGERLKVEIDLPYIYAQARLPAFSLQPLVENAIKHGTAHLLGPGHIRLFAEPGKNEHTLLVHVEDNAGLYPLARQAGAGLGMTLVDKRLKARFGERFGLAVDALAERYTRITLTLPLNEESPDASAAG
ncbi:sensor histidine kinase [Chitinilyticum piscinae]|uniref:histidine kinase n=1 Tax=Chitinilyticum piscinae TaxID=2866724 RepID=A0A8J7FM85_9NEIS|nr:sensor histidine kinase [Chitinilyticum piscinae]MBE9609001.1 sensor histidine kinase [Chitinilyticum piscinae]